MRVHSAVFFMIQISVTRKLLEVMPAKEAHALTLLSSSGHIWGWPEDATTVS